MRSMVLTIVAAALLSQTGSVHKHSSIPQEAAQLKNPLPSTADNLAKAKPQYEAFCVQCHGADGKARTPLAGKLPIRPANLSGYAMEAMEDGEIYWVISNGLDNNMPAFAHDLSETARWQLVQYVRELRRQQRAVEKARLGPYDWRLPPGFPFPNVPPDNPMTQEKVELGRYLFYDKRLSLNETQSCGDCHRQELAFTDGRARAVGSTGQSHPRSAMSLVNVAYSPVLTWANPLLRNLEGQMLVPLFGEDPIELGMVGKEDVLLARLRSDARYQKLFAGAFPAQKDPVSVATVTKAIACFERTILSGRSPYDQYRLGNEPNAISDSAKRGEKLFFSERLECFHCHGGFNFTGTVDYLDKGFSEVEFHNTGLYNLKGQFSYPTQNVGLYQFTNQPEDVGKFKAPTLRNIAVTGPYMHDGSVKTLADAIDHYRSGGRTIKDGPYAGIGADNPNKSEFIRGFELSSEEKADLLTFLNSLTDHTLLTDPGLSNPWPATTGSTKSRPAPHSRTASKLH